MMFVFSLKYRFSFVWRFCETSVPNFVFVCIYLLSTVCKCYIENVHISHTYREIRCEILASVISGEMLDDTNIKCIDTMEYEYEHIYSYYYYAFVVWLSLLWRASLSPSVCECVSYTILDFSFFFYCLQTIGHVVIIEYWISFVRKLFLDNIVWKYTFLDGIYVSCVCSLSVTNTSI